MRIGHNGDMKMTVNNDWLLEEYDDGSTVHLASYSGGADPGGAWSRVWLRFTDKDGSETRREYRIQSSDRP